MSTTIYDENEARPARRFSGLLTLAVGIGLSAWYVRDMGRTISGDIQAFSLSVRLTVGAFGRVSRVEKLD